VLSLIPHSDKVFAESELIIELELVHDSYRDEFALWDRILINADFDFFFFSFSTL